MAKSYKYHEEHSKLSSSGAQARALQELYYYSGKPCKRGHLAPRYSSSGNCISCIEQKRSVVFQRFKGSAPRRSEIDQELAEKSHNEGHKNYKSNRVCPKGHNIRFVTSNNCVECSKNSLRKRREAARWSRIKKEYGITKEQYQEMMKNQGGICCICSIDLLSVSSHIDHCHESKKVRGILCSKCNQAIGLLDESEDKIIFALKYIRSHKC